MSHLSLLKVQLSDIEAIKDMLQQVFGKDGQVLDIKVSEQTDLIVQNRYTDHDEKRYANIVLNTKSFGATADIGFAWNEEEKSYEMVWDGWSIQNHLMSFLREDYEYFRKNHKGESFDSFVKHFFSQEYGIAKTLRGVKQVKGNVVERVREESGAIRLRVRGRKPQVIGRGSR
jgi:hypothetical protein